MADAFWHPTLDALPDSLAVLDEACDVVAVNRAWREFSRENGGDGLAVGGNYLDVCDRVAGEDAFSAEVAAALREFVAGARTAFSRVYPCHAPWEQRWFSLQVALLEREGVRRLLVTHRDVTDRHDAHRRNEAQAALLDAVGAAITVTDLDGTITHWSDGAERLYGWRSEEVVGLRLDAVTATPEEQVPLGEPPSAAAGNGTWDRRGDVRHRDGRRFSAHVRNRLVHDGEGQVSGIIGVTVDTTERETLERHLHGARDLRDAVLQTMPDGLYVLDGDGRVTLINEAAETLLGWPRGALLGTVLHERVQARTADGLPRGADERLDVRALRAGGTMRVDDDAFEHRDGTSVPVTYSAAPFISEAGEQGSVVVFKDVSRRRARELLVHHELEALSWVRRIHEALEEDRFVLYAQPIVDIASGETVQHELLLRMIAPDGEIIAPGEFLPAAEAHGLIRAIDRRVVELAFGYAAEGHPIEVNLSADSIGDPHLFGFVQDELEAQCVDPRLIVFEITETALIENEAAAQTFTEAVVELGCAIALDDFGTGYGSFHYLKQLPVHVLKIDREFVRDIDGEQGEDNRHVVTAIVTLAKGMGKTTIAEGVETEAALAMIRELGVDSAQGYLFARPTPARDVLPTRHR